MCGIAGLIKFKGGVDTKLFKEMTKTIAHRGPDDEGYLYGDMQRGGFVLAGDSDTPPGVYASTLHYCPEYRHDELPKAHYNLAMSNRRLSIFDLSPAGHQPMSDKGKTIWIVHNGEIYNYRELREELKALGYEFYSDTDTEVIINAYKEWKEGCLSRFNGMWAFALWDVKAEKIFCSRDRFGVKPFYYYHGEEMFVFASEIKALLKSGKRPEPDDGLIFDFLKYGISDHTDDTFFIGIKRLPAAHYLMIDARGDHEVRRYWDISVSGKISSDEYGNYPDEFIGLFTDSIRLRLRSDVPVGSCLSGGLDSSSIVCVANDLMFPDGNAGAHERQKTFSACYENSKIDERKYIEEVISKTNAERNYVFPSAEGFAEELKSLLWHQEEPFGGTNIYAQWCVMKAVRQRGVKVVLDGQGADEQLGGYRKFYIFYFYELLKNRKYIDLANEFMRFFLSAGILKTLNIKYGARYFKVGNRILGIDNLLSEGLKRKVSERKMDYGYKGSLAELIKEDLFRYSLPVLLRYEDKNSMSHSVEARLPFLDYRLVEKLSSFPLSQKMNRGWTKRILRDATMGILPEKIRLRKTKRGFSTPEGDWIKGALSGLVKKTVEKPLFLSNYVMKKPLLDYCENLMAGKPFHQPRILFRFFIVESWGRAFFG
jgi:asparagine synthase (glutamine-hydrolysing)